MRKFLFLFLAAVTFIFPAPPAPERGKIRFGVHVLDAQDETLRKVREMGATWVIYPVLWRDIEPYPGRYNWAALDLALQAMEYYRLNPVFRVDHPPAWASSSPHPNSPPKEPSLYAEFIRKLSSRYKGRVKAYIIWNEPNLAQEWGNFPPDPQGYLSLLRSAAKAIRQTDPGAIIVSAGLAPTNELSQKAMDDRLYLNRLYEAGASEYFDVLGAHPYGFAYPPDDPKGAHNGLNMARLEDLREIMVLYGDGKKEVWVTEFGWTTEGYGNWAWAEVTPEEQARYLVEAVKIAASRWPWVGMMAVWLLSSAEIDLAYRGFNLLNPDGSPKPAWESLRAFARFSPYLRRDLLPEPPSPQRIVILASDQIVHLGDSEYPYPWEPLYLMRNPSPSWEWAFYVRKPERKCWLLTIELMQSNERGNALFLNGEQVALLPAEVWEGLWVNFPIEIPPGFLREGRNEIAVKITKRIPPWQHDDLIWDDLQFRHVILREIACP